MAPWRQGDALQAALDIGADIRYQEQAEGQLQQSQAVLYTNTCAFTSFTADGTRWATEANALITALQQSCSPPAPKPVQSPAPQTPMPERGRWRQLQQGRQAWNHLHQQPQPHTDQRASAGEGAAAIAVPPHQNPAADQK